MEHLASWVICALVKQGRFNVYDLESIWNDFIGLGHVTCPNNVNKCCLCEYFHIRFMELQLSHIITFYFFVVEFLFCVKFQKGNFSHCACRIDEAPHVFLLKGYSLSSMPQMSITTAERTAANYRLMPGCLTLQAGICISGFKMRIDHQPPLYSIRFSFANISRGDRCDSLKGVNERVFP